MYLYVSSFIIIIIGVKQVQSNKVFFLVKNDRRGAKANGSNAIREIILDGNRGDNNDDDDDDDCQQTSRSGSIANNLTKR